MVAQLTFTPDEVAAMAQLASRHPRTDRIEVREVRDDADVGWLLMLCRVLGQSAIGEYVISPTGRAWLRDPYKAAQWARGRQVIGEEVEA